MYLCGRIVVFVALFDRGRRERLEPHARLGAACDNNPSIFSVVEEGTGRAHSPDLGILMATYRFSFLDPSECLHTLAPCLACFAQNKRIYKQLTPDRKVRLFSAKKSVIFSCTRPFQRGNYIL